VVKAIFLLLLSLLCAASAEMPTKISAANTFAFEQFLLVPLRVHLFSTPDKPRLTTSLTAMDISRILGKVNKVWAQAGIQFYLESLVREPAANPSLYDKNRASDQFHWMIQLCPPETLGAQVYNIYFVKEMSVNGISLKDAVFVKDEAVLTSVPGGLNEPLPRVTAHELGHKLSLEHRQNGTNLMTPGTTGISLNEAEIKQARTATMTVPWIETADAIFKRAGTLQESGRVAEARLWYERLSRLPIDAPQVKTARQRLK